MVHIGWGSPPLTRGKVGRLFCPAQLLGITPAYAGKRGRSRLPQAVTRDHPRLRGEKHTRGFSYLYGTGSPPLTRGKGADLRQVLLRPGITPAYAGKRPFSASRCRGFWDHPRLRGEKALRRRRFHPGAGSPPLTRGKAQGRDTVCKTLRITPAYAGKRRKLRENHA